VLKTKPVAYNGSVYNIPVDDEGCAPESALIARFGQICEGTRSGVRRSVVRDLNKTSEETITLTKNTKPEDIVAWWAYPNEMDIIGIDDENTVAYDTTGATRKSSLKYQRRIGVSGTANEREMIRKTLDASFTAGELDKMTREGGTYSVAFSGRKNLGNHSAGYYRPDTKDIVIMKSAGPGTVIHESVHKLRHIDGSRKGKYTSSKIDEVINEKDPSKRSALRALEEAGTEAETIARLSPFEVNGRRTSYYGFISKNDEEARRFIKEDRELLVGHADPAKRGVRGRAAERTVEKEFPRLHISRYKNE
jgi:hypothetical protein